MLKRNKQILWVYLLLTAAVIISFQQVSQCGFVGFDDPEYVTENVHIHNGITAEAMRWVLTTTHANFWHPLTMLSHMTDVELFGLNPQGHHLTSLLFHIANTLLLFFVLHRMTKATWQSAFVAALFAVHPLRVESVAWVAERKDVLSTFFWMLTMVAYVYYVERPRLGIYLVVFAFFAFGLMAKPMLVTLPFVMLLLDYWPLDRLGQKQVAGGKEQGASIEEHVEKGREFVPQRKYGWAAILPLLIEKIPFFALVPLFSVLTYVAEGESVVNNSPRVWIPNAFVSYAIYIGKMIWPVNLAVFYPHPGVWPLWQAAGAGLLFCAITVAVILRAKRSPYLVLGWLWFAGTLVPVIGIVQIGRHGMADRYTYVPLIGLFIMIAWGVPELLQRWRYWKETLFVSSGLALLCLMICTRTQVGYWRDSISLFDHAIEVAGHSDVMHYDRGVAYERLGDTPRAIQDYNMAVDVNPGYVDALFNLGAAYAKLGDHRQAISNYDRAIAINPQSARFHNSRGISYAVIGDYEQAISDFDRAIEIDSGYPDGYYNRGIASLRIGREGQAISDFEMSLKINPQNADAYNNRGIAFARTGNYRQAIEDCGRAVEINPQYAGAYNNLGIVYLQIGRESQAIENLQKAARLDNEDAKNTLRSMGMSW